jgi:hypothetical protein
VARVLTAVQVTVRPAQEAEWLATVHALATRLVSRGMHLWVFRSRSEPDRYLEFTEGKDDAAHRRHGPADIEEAALERRLQELAQYPTSTSVPVWEEVPAQPPDEGS